MAICIWGRPHWIEDENLSTLGYFCFSGCWFSQFFKCLKYWKSDLSNTLLKQNLRLKTLGYLLFILLFSYLLFGCPMANFYWGNTLTHPMLITAFWLFLVQSWLEGIEPLHLNECPVSFDHNAINHVATHPKLQKIIFPGLHPVFTKCPQYPK